MWLRITSTFVVAIVLYSCGGQSDEETKNKISESGAKRTLATGENGIARPEGFVVEKLLDVSLRAQGSWVSLAFDKKGNLLAGAENGPLHRVILTEDGKVEKVDVVKGVPGRVHGILEAFGSLYVVSHERNALVRCRDLDGDGNYDQENSILPLDYKGEDGPRNIILTEDGGGLYLIAGKQCGIPPHSEFPSLHVHGGWIGRLTPDASKVHIVAAGLGNARSIVLNAHGDLFTCDADTAYDMGLPWYRHPRFLHVANGADFGWREGPEKWPGHYADSLPKIADLGSASPTGIISGHMTHFPNRYRNAVFVLDRAFGAIHAVHLTPKDASYLAEPELFLSGKNLHLADAVVAKDGSLYFVTGGRNLPSSLYRVRHKNPSPISKGSPASHRLRKQRLRLETFHRAPPSNIALRGAWSGINSPDRFVRHAARIALERQPINGWQTLFEQETSNRGAIQSSLALARVAPAHRRAALAQLANLKFNNLLTENKLAFLRTFAIAVKFKPEPPPELLAIILPQLNAAYPADDHALNQELSRVLGEAFSPEGTPNFIEKTLHLIENHKVNRPSFDKTLLKNNPIKARHYFRFAEVPPDPLGVHLAFIVSHVDAAHWSQEQMLRLYRWLSQTALNAPQGTNYRKVVTRLAHSVFNALPTELKRKTSPPSPPSP